MRWLSGSNQVCSLSKRTCFIHLNGGSGLTEFSIVMERSWTGDAFPCRKSSSVWSRLSSRWCADIHRECQPDKQTLVLTLGFQTGKKSGVICGMKSKKRWYVVDTEQKPEGPQNWGYKVQTQILSKLLYKCGPWGSICQQGECSDSCFLEGGKEDLVVEQDDSRGGGCSSSEGGSLTWVPCPDKSMSVVKKVVLVEMSEDSMLKFFFRKKWKNWYRDTGTDRM